MKSYDIVVVNKTTLPLEQITPAINAINRQLREDIRQIWEVDAFVGVIQQNMPIPANRYVVELRENLPDPALGGVHDFEERGNVYALVARHGPIYKGEYLPWSLALSHEILEMVVDPYGDRMKEGESLDGKETVSYLMEVCDPCQHFIHSKVIDGICLSDFYTPDYFDKGPWNKGPFSAYGSITRAMDVLPGGYICWRNAYGQWYRGDWNNNPQKVTVRQLRDFRLLPAGSLRQRIDYHTHLMEARAPFQKLNKEVERCFHRRFVKKFQEIKRAQVYLKTRTAARELALSNHEMLHDKVRKNHIKLTWGAARQIQRR